MGSAKVWRKVIPSLPRGYKSVAIDLPGFGETPPFAHEMQTIKQYAELVRRIVEKLSASEPLALIVADSLGTRVMLELLSDNSIPSKGLFLSGCPIEGLAGKVSFLKVRGLVSNSLRVFRRAPEFIITLAPTLFSLSALRHLKHIDTDVLKAALSSDPESVESIITELFRPFELEKIQAPREIKSVIVRGKDDRIVSRSSAVELSNALGANLIELSKVGHTPMLENPREYAQAISSTLFELVS